MKNNKHLKSTLFLLMVLLGTGMFSGCDGSNDPAVVNDVNDVISDGNTPADENTPAVNDTKNEIIQKGWYVRLSVEDGTRKESSTVLGYLEGAGDGKEKYESEALTPFGGSYLYTTLYHTDFGSVQNYKSDYRVYKEAGQKSDIWTIKVNSGDVNADVTLSWNGITYVTKRAQGGFEEELKIDAPELSLMRVVDVESGDVMLASENGMEISFNMNGSHQRTFEWYLLADGEPEPDVMPTEKSSAVSAKSMKTMSKTKETSDAFAPPSFEKL